MEFIVSLNRLIDLAVNGHPTPLPELHSIRWILEAFFACEWWMTYTAPYNLSKTKCFTFTSHLVSLSHTHTKQWT